MEWSYQYDHGGSSKATCPSRPLPAPHGSTATRSRTDVIVCCTMAWRSDRNLYRSTEISTPPSRRPPDASSVSSRTLAAWWRERGEPVREAGETQRMGLGFPCADGSAGPGLPGACPPAPTRAPAAARPRDEGRWGSSDPASRSRGLRRDSHRTPHACGRRGRGRSAGRGTYRAARGCVEEVSWLVAG